MFRTLASVLLSRSHVLLRAAEYRKSPHQWLLEGLVFARARWLPRCAVLELLLRRLPAGGRASLPLVQGAGGRDEVPLPNVPGRWPCRSLVGDRPPEFWRDATTGDWWSIAGPLKLTGETQVRTSPATDFSESRLDAERITEAWRREEDFLVQYVHRPPVVQGAVPGYGFGDVLLGAATVFEQAQALGRTPKVDFTRASWAEHLVARYRTGLGEGESIEYIYHGGADSKFRDARLVFTNRRPRRWSTDVQTFLAEECLTPTPSMRLHLGELRSMLSLGSGRFGALHVRTGDQHLTGGAASDLSLVARDLIKRTHSLDASLRWLLLTDNAALKQLLRAEMAVTPGRPAHTGAAHSREDDVRSTIADFMLMSGAAVIVQASIYPWGSAFSELASSVWGIPLTRTRITI